MLDGSSGRSSLLYPHPDINGGRHDVQPFVQVAVPPDGWFEFDDTPGTERVRIYVTEEPDRTVPGVARPALRAESIARETMDAIRNGVGARDLFFTRSEDETQSTIVVSDAASRVYWTVDLHHR